MKHAVGSINDISQEFLASTALAARLRRKTSHRITLRLSDEEHAKLLHLCQGMTVSAYVRQCLFGD